MSVVLSYDSLRELKSVNRVFEAGSSKKVDSAVEARMAGGKGSRHERDGNGDVLLDPHSHSSLATTSLGGAARYQRRCRGNAGRAAAGHAELRRPLDLPPLLCSLRGGRLLIE